MPQAVDGHAAADCPGRRVAHARVPDRRLTSPGCYEKTQVTAPITFRAQQASQRLLIVKVPSAGAALRGGPATPGAAWLRAAGEGPGRSASTAATGRVR